MSDEEWIRAYASAIDADVADVRAAYDLLAAECGDRGLARELMENISP